MKRRGFLQGGLCAGVALGIATARAQTSMGRFEPTSAYVDRMVRGWPVRINRSFLGTDARLCQEALQLLESHLYRVTRVVPTAALTRLRQIRIWVERKEGHHPCLVYHPSPVWLSEHDMNPDKARCVEVADAANFLDWEHQQPWMVLHELAHGYHHQFLPEGFDNAEVKAAYEAAVGAKIYESVLRTSGQRERHYALTNPQEYFAELSESYFGTNDFFPFVRAELKEHDLTGYRMIEKMWGVRND